MMKFKAELKEIYCKVIFEDDMPTHVYGDHQRLMQVLINLISNALKFTFEGGVTIVASYIRKTNKIYCEVKDTGEGIKKEEGDGRRGFLH